MTRLTLNTETGQIHTKEPTLLVETVIEIETDNLLLLKNKARRDLGYIIGIFEKLQQSPGKSQTSNNKLNDYIQLKEGIHLRYPSEFKNHYYPNIEHLTNRLVNSGLYINQYGFPVIGKEKIIEKLGQDEIFKIYIPLINNSF